MDGGYYAIKGFAYQIDKAIVESLSAENDEKRFNIEQIQDIGSEDFIMQVKYKEAQDYSPSKIREPVLQLIEAFRLNPDVDYHLYCFFKDQSEATRVLNFDELNIVLAPNNGSSDGAISMNDRLNQLDDDLKRRFMGRFHLTFAPSFQVQYQSAIAQLNRLSFIGSNHQVAVFYYENIVGFLRDLVIGNPNPEDRIFTKKELLSYLKTGKKLIFTSAYKEFMGKKEYGKFIKEKIVPPLKNKENLFYFGDIEIDPSLSLGGLIHDILKAYFKGATYDIKPPTMVIPNRDVDTVKSYLAANGTLFNDGYESFGFNSDIFLSKPIVSRRTLSNGKSSDTLKDISFSVRLVSENSFRNLDIENGYFNRIYLFDAKTSVAGQQLLRLDELDTLQIKKILA